MFFPRLNLLTILIYRVANCTLWFLKPPHIEAKEELIYSVKILVGSSSLLGLLETIGNSAYNLSPWAHLNQLGGSQHKYSMWPPDRGLKGIQGMSRLQLLIQHLPHPHQLWEGESG